MKSTRLLILLMLGLFALASFAQTPVSINGQLKVVGTKLHNQCDNPIQLRGMSTHGIQWYGWGDCLTETSLDTLAYGWKADILRISMYIQEDGYETNPTGFTNQVKTLINKATQRGMYALVDFHQLSPGDPNYNLNNAKTFFTEIANTYKNQNNIIYDVCNEPNGNSVTWAVIKNYANQIIPVIRAIDNDAVILVGTHGWASMGVSLGNNNGYMDIVNNPLSFPNVMYTFHFYAADHGNTYYTALDKASTALPVFVTEFGTQEASGDGVNDFTMSQKYIDLMRTKKISWCNWNYSDDSRSGAVWKTGTCSAGPWNAGKLKAAGTWIKDKIMNPADDFVCVTTSNGVENHAKMDVRVFPNPANSKITLLSEGFTRYRILTITGVVANEGLITSQNFELSIEKLDSGFYILELTGDQAVKPVSFIKL